MRGALGTRMAAAGREATLPQKVGAVVLLLGLNAAVLLAPIDYGFLGGFAYPGAFLVTLVANGAVVAPVPYIPIVAQIAASAPIPALVVVAAATGSALGESVAFAVGRVEKDVLSGHRWYERLRSYMSDSRRTALFLFLFSIPLNPFFDVAGLAAGALGVPFRVFFVTVWLGRLVRLALIAAIALGIAGLPPIAL